MICLSHRFNLGLWGRFQESKDGLEEPCDIDPTHACGAKDTKTEVEDYYRASQLNENGCGPTNRALKKEITNNPASILCTLTEQDT